MNENRIFKIKLAITGGLLCAALTAHAGDPRTNSWLTTYAGKYARIYTSDANKTNGMASTTWSTGTTSQSSPTYCGIQEVNASANWVYIRSSGLASLVMGPWYLNTNHTMAFPSYPTNQKLLYRIPRNPSVPASKTSSGGGPIGYFVDGVTMFNSWDAYSYNTTTLADQMNYAAGRWFRDAYVNEGATFDPNNAHQAGGQHHYHANPPGLRYLLGDHVDFNPTNKAYTESTNVPTKHSPILGWVADGFPIYGPYGYSVSNDASSGIRRMISGYVIRNGQYGTSNLTANGRTTIPQWSVRLFNVSSNQVGPNVSSSFPLGRYMEDNDYLGDHGIVQGTNTFDLDEYNGRWCVTPEFTNGTYAYFVSISSNGTPVFPYNIGRGYYGNPTGSNTTTAVMSTNTPLTVYFMGGTNLQDVMGAPAVNPASGNVTLAWSAVEGGTYQVNVSTNLTTWTTNLALTLTATNTTASTIETGAASANPNRFYRVNRTSVATFDSTGY
jgi:hypothetical protein